MVSEVAKKDRRDAFMVWRGTMSGISCFRNTFTGHLFEIGPGYAFYWDAALQRGSITGRLVVEDQYGRAVGTLITSNYLDVEPLPEMELIAWMAK